MARRCWSKRAHRIATALAAQVHAIEAALAGVHTYEPVRFSTDAQECARYWNVRKGMFPSVGAMRKVGTTVIIEDVAFPVSRLAEATLDLQRLLAAHGYPDAIIFGHALEGNLHFVFTQDFNSGGRGRAVSRLHGRAVPDGRRQIRWLAQGGARHRPQRRALRRARMGRRSLCAHAGDQAPVRPARLAQSRRDPQRRSRRACEEPEAAAACDPIVDKCIECGFCEPKCPSRGLTLSPRQRIVGWREIARRERTGEDAAATATLRELYDYHGIDTCAACGLCATACPVGIETGLLIKALRGRRSRSARAARSRRGRRSLCRDDGRRSRGTRRRRRAARAGRHAGDAALARRHAPRIGRPDSQVVARAAARRQFPGPRYAAARDGR